MGVVSDSGEHLLTTGVAPLRAGDVVLVRPSERHAVRGSAPDGLEFVNIAFPSSIWQGLLDLTRTPTWSSGGPVSFRQTAAVPVFEHALDRFQNAPTAYDLLRFWIDVLDLLAPGDPGGSGIPDWLAKACTSMRAEQNLGGGVPRLLELAGVSAAHLSRSMRAAYGVTRPPSSPTSASNTPPPC